MQGLLLLLGAPLLASAQATEVVTSPPQPPITIVLKGGAVHTRRQAETARRLAVEAWLQNNGVITITQNKKVLPIFLKQIAHN